MLTLKDVKYLNNVNDILIIKQEYEKDPDIALTALTEKYDIKEINVVDMNGILADRRDRRRNRQLRLRALQRTEAQRHRAGSLQRAQEIFVFIAQLGFHSFQKA